MRTRSSCRLVWQRRPPPALPQQAAGCAQRSTCEGKTHSSSYKGPRKHRNRAKHPMCGMLELIYLNLNGYLLHYIYIYTVFEIRTCNLRKDRTDDGIDKHLASREM